MVSLNNVSFGYGGHTIVKDCSYNFKPGAKVGLIGPNGAGKSTLFRVIVGELSPTEGQVGKSKSTRIEFFNQDLLSTRRQDPILDVVIEGFKDVLEVKHQLEALTRELEHHYNDSLIHKMGEVQARFEHLGGYALEAKAEEVLAGLGFAHHDFQRPLNEFSGGWRMRVLLGKMLISKPDLLLLDEPSNHLDLPSIEWLEAYLQTYSGSFVLISHDKNFLDNTVREILEISGKKLIPYQGNYSNYLIEKKERQEIEENAYRNQQKKIKDTERFITRFRAKATKARQVQSRIKSLEKMDLIELESEQVRSMNIRFAVAQRAGKIIAHSDGFDQSYGELHLFQKATFKIHREDKVALIGANGKGKSTLLKVIGGMVPVEGKVALGHNVQMEYYAQHQLEQLNLENTVLQEAMNGVSKKTEKEVRDVLGSFLFSGEDVEKKVKVLSGGEKARVALARIFMKEPNFLLLDEPTNHLDLNSIQILREALQKYEGTFVVVSHDRDFIAGIANKIWTLEGHGIKEHPGDYESYKYWVAQKNKPEKKDSERFQKKPSKQITKGNPSGKETHKVLEQNIKRVESQIEGAETNINALEARLLEPEVLANPKQGSEIQRTIESIKNELDNLLSEWEALQTKLEGPKKGMK